MKFERKFYQNSFSKDFERLWENLEKDHVTTPIQITTKMMRFLDQMMMNKNHPRTIARFIFIDWSKIVIDAYFRVDIIQ